MDYIKEALRIIYGSKSRAGGASFMNIAEYYYMGGWLSVVICSAFIGRLYKFLWNWFYLRKDEILAQVIYTKSYICVCSYK